MSKKNNTGLLIALGAVIGAAAAGISYYLKYKSFNDEIDKDFHDYEDEDAVEETDDEPVKFDEAGRTYISISKPAETEKVCEEDAAEEVPAVEAAEEATAEVTEEPAKETPIAATVEEDTEGAN